MKSYLPIQFALFRISLGSLLVFYFLSLFPYARELFSNQGMVPDASINPALIFPNPFWYFDSPKAIEIFLIVLIASAAMFAVGIFRHLNAILLWIGVVFLLNRNTLIADVRFGYLGWMLLATLAVPKGEPLSVMRKGFPTWEFPKPLCIGAWVIFAITYSASGLVKLSHPLWREGTALQFILSGPDAHIWWLQSILLMLPLWLIKFLTWATLGMEILCAPLCIWNYTRRIAWFGLTLMHLGILLVLPLFDLTATILIFHMFVFDSRWLFKKP